MLVLAACSADEKADCSYANGILNCDASSIVLPLGESKSAPIPARTLVPIKKNNDPFLIWLEEPNERFTLSTQMTEKSVAHALVTAAGVGKGFGGGGGGSWSDNPIKTIGNTAIKLTENVDCVSQNIDVTAINSLQRYCFASLNNGQTGGAYLPPPPLLSDYLEVTNLLGLAIGSDDLKISAPSRTLQSKIPVGLEQGFVLCSPLRPAFVAMVSPSAMLIPVLQYYQSKYDQISWSLREHRAQTIGVVSADAASTLLRLIGLVVPLDSGGICEKRAAAWLGENVQSLAENWIASLSDSEDRRKATLGWAVDMGARLAQLMGSCTVEQFAKNGTKLAFAKYFDLLAKVLKKFALYQQVLEGAELASSALQTTLYDVRATWSYPQQQCQLSPMCDALCTGKCGTIGSCTCSQCASGRCVSNLCEPCPSNFCAVNRFGSGSYCDGNSSVTCGFAGDCQIEVKRELCPSGCTSGLCKISPMETCNGIDDDGNGIIDDPSTCWQKIYRFVNNTTKSRCYGTSTSPPAACAGYSYERPAFIVRTSAVPDTSERRQCSKGTDHVITQPGGAEYSTLAAMGFDCSMSLGYFYSFGKGPPAARTPFLGNCPLWRFRYDFGSGQSHLFSLGSDILTGMTCEAPARADVYSDGTACFAGTPAGC